MLTVSHLRHPSVFPFYYGRGTSEEKVTEEQSVEIMQLSEGLEIF